jgi:MurNAc alpha-1-phosphate uridylyltransferase
MRIRRAIVLAAGRGERLGELTENGAKAMLEVDGKTLLEHVLGSLVGLVQEVYVTVGYHGDAVAAHATAGGAAGTIATTGRGNAWWLHHSLLGLLDEPVLLSTCDVLADLDLDALGSEYRALGAPHCLLLPVSPVAGVAGDYIFAEGPRVLRLARDEVAPTYCSGLQILDPGRIRRAVPPDDDFTGIWRRLAERGELYVSERRVTGWTALDGPGSSLTRTRSMRLRASSK